MTSREWDERYGDRELLWSAQPNRFLVEEVTGLVPGRALDLGCGEGRNAVWLAACGWAVTGVDFSSVGIGKARALAERSGVEVDWQIGDLTAWEPAETYELVLVFYVHLPPEQLGAVLDRATRALAPGGTLLIVGHALRNLEEGFGGPPTPEVLYTVTGLTAALDGVELERAGEVERTVEADGVGHTAIDVLVRARR